VLPVGGHLVPKAGNVQIRQVQSGRKQHTEMVRVAGTQGRSSERRTAAGSGGFMI
jgi:hypothetical protein